MELTKLTWKMHALIKIETVTHLVKHKPIKLSV